MSSLAFLARRVSVSSDAKGYCLSESERERVNQIPRITPHPKVSPFLGSKKTARVVVVVVALLEKKKSLQNVSSFLVPFFRVGGAFLERQSHAPEKDDDDA